MLSSNVNANDINLSGKLKALGRLLKSLKNETEEKIIVVSSFTTTLDLIEVALGIVGAATANAKTVSLPSEQVQVL